MAQIAEVLHQLATEEKEKALAVLTHAQEMKMAQQQKDPIETCKKNPEEKDTVGMQEVIPDTQVGDSIKGKGSGEDIFVDKDRPLGIDFPIDGELFGELGELRVHLTRAEKRRQPAVDKAAEVKPGGQRTTTAEVSGRAGHD